MVRRKSTAAALSGAISLVIGIGDVSKTVVSVSRTEPAQVFAIVAGSSARIFLS